MAEKQDIPMNSFPLVTNPKYVYVEKADSSQGRMDFEAVSKLLSIGTIALSTISDLNQAYIDLDQGLSVIFVGNTLNSPINFGICIHIQRSVRADKNGSQMIFQIVSGGGNTFIREASSNGSVLNYTSWRKI